MEPVDLLLAFLGIMVAVPVVGTFLLFIPHATVRKLGQWSLAIGYLSCGTAVLACVWGSTRESAGIGNDIFLLIAVLPAVLGFVWFKLWQFGRRREYLDSLPIDLRRHEEISDLNKSIDLLACELRRKERRVESWLISRRERTRLRGEIPLLRLMLKKLEVERASR